MGMGPDGPMMGMGLDGSRGMGPMMMGSDDYCVMIIMIIQFRL